jgi:hypothetical protein
MSESQALSPTQPNLPALRDTDPKLILQRYLSDETTKEIAASYGVTRQALGQYLLKVAESEWKEAQVARALARKESAEDDLEDAEKTPDMLSLSRARERLKAAQWDLERVCRRIYGQDAPPQGVNAVQININLRREDATIAAHNDVIEVEESKPQS